VHAAAVAGGKSITRSACRSPAGAVPACGAEILDRLPSEISAGVESVDQIRSTRSRASRDASGGRAAVITLADLSASWP